MKDMLGRDELITVDKALELLLQHAPFKIPEEIALPLEESYGYILSGDIVSPEDLPSFSRTTVDGFAVNAADTFGATEGMPAYLNIKGEIKMGDRPQFVLNKGEAAKISTGGMLPQGADAALMFEHTQQVDEKMIEALRPVSPGEHVIQAGEDAKTGETILRKGRRLRPQDIGALAGLGIATVWVYKKPKVSIISTGDEIVPVDRPVNPGQVRDINSYTLSGLISGAGGVPERTGIFKDEYEIIRNVVKDSLKDSQMVLISGGSSVGAKDMTAKIIDDLGEPGVLFHGVSLKPGKPTIGGIVNGIPIFGLPGHPAAVSVCFGLFIMPVLEILSGLAGTGFEKNKRTIMAKVTKNVSSSPGREEHVGVKLEEKNGEIWASPLLGKSGLITTLTQADGTAVIPLRKTGVREGEFVEVRLF
jgi:molybdopterin molybdotransferase